jgi:uncharacterized protein YkwD
MSRTAAAAAMVAATLALTLGPVAPAGPSVAATAAPTGEAAHEATHEATNRAGAATPAKKYQRQAHQATNARRADHGRARLAKQKCLQRFAVRHAKAMAAASSMHHQSLGPIMSACGLRAVGENVAYGFASGRSVVNDGWMNSSGHRANILDPGYRLMGIGARKSPDGRWYVAQVFGRKA